MQFGLSKCSYLKIKRGKAVTSARAMQVKGVKISPVCKGDTYRYLGLDECITYDGALNKERVASAYTKRLRKIWSSELSARNKCIAHNSFAVPVLTPTFGILQWSIEELEALDVKTRKLLTSTGNFNRNGDVDRLYLPRNEGGRGLRSIYSIFKARIVSLYQHIVKASVSRPLIKQLLDHERDGICRIATQLTDLFKVVHEPSRSPRAWGKLISSSINKEKKELFQAKVMHGYTSREMHKKPEVDLPLSLSWYKNNIMTSEFEAYANAIEEQEIGTRYLLAKRNADSSESLFRDSKCRLCRSAVEDVSHVIAGCDKMAARYYLPLRHDALARYMWNAVRRIDNVTKSIDNDQQLGDEFIDTDGLREYWWNIPVKTCTKVKYNRPDIITWNHQEKQCTIIEIACPLDVNIVAKEKEKEVKYGPLIRNLQMLYKGYQFTFVPIVVGAMGFVTKALKGHVQQLGFPEREAAYIIRKLQVLSVCGTVKIAKTLLNFKM
jgi:hypothetical protein